MRLTFSLRVSRVVLIVLALLATAVPIVVAPYTATAMTGSVVINEFVAANDNGLVDNTGAFEDWIELHNTTNGAVSLTGWTLADGDGSYTFADTTIAANDYLVVFASGDVIRSTTNELHLPFKLSAAGEPLELRDSADGVSEPSFPAPGFPALPTDVSYGLDANGALAFFTSPTPGGANAGALTGFVEPVTFSIPHGFYDSSQTVVLDTATSGATIRYTLDSSTPSSTHGTVLSPGQSITISQTSTVRAIAYRTGWIPSGVETSTYLFTADIITQSSTPSGWPSSGSVNGHVLDYGMDPNIVNGNESAVAASLTAIPTLSVVTDQPNLTDGSTGIYVNPWNTGIAWERPASVELIDPSGAESGFQINAGLRLRGGGSRRNSNPKHSLRLYFRNDYGDGNLEYPLFGPGGVDNFDSIGLATGQNGGWQFRLEEDATWMRAIWSRRTQAAMGQPDTDSKHYHLYLNGQYWGLYYIQERLSGGHGVEHFGGNEDDYDVVGGNWLAAGTASDGSTDGLRALWPIVSDLNVTDTEYATLSAAVNLSSLADYFLLHFYTGDYDASPMGWNTENGRWADSNNWRAMRNRTGVGEAGKWLFFDHDSEISMCAGASAVNVDNTTPWRLQSGTVPGHQVVTPAWLHEALLTHPAYQQIFRDKVAQHMQTPGGALTIAANQARVDALAAELTGAIDAEAARWGDSLGDPANDRFDWEANVAALRDCALRRFAYTQTQLEQDGLWPAQNAPAITPNGGPVSYETSVVIDSNGASGTIWYTTDGSDPRGPTGSVSATAVRYSEAISIVQDTTIRTRTLSGSDWTPLAEASFTLSTPAGPVTLLLNEYNAVGGSRFLGGGAAGDITNGSDATFGRVAGNGGDWFELVVLEDLDITGFTFEIWHLDNGLPQRSAALTVAQTPALQSLKPGTILTVSEAIADDLSFDPGAEDWHINLQANSAGQGAHFTAGSQQNFAIDNDDTQIAIFDATGQPVQLRTGEGTVAGVSVSSQEVFKLEATPTAEVTFDSPLFADGTSSTWGLPNVWAAGTVTQDLSALRVLIGDTNCDGRMNVTDALVIAQYTVGTRTGATSCPINRSTQIMVGAADVNASGNINVADALLVAQCTVAIPNTFCPD